MVIKNRSSDQIRKWLMPLLSLLLIPEVVEAHSVAIFAFIYFGGFFYFIVLSFSIAILPRYEGKRVKCWLWILGSVASGYAISVFINDDRLVALFPLFVYIIPLFPLLIIKRNEHSQ